MIPDDHELVLGYLWRHSHGRSHCARAIASQLPPFLRAVFMTFECKTWCRMFILESQIRHFSADECRYAVLFFDIITWYYLELLTNPESERTKATRYFQTRQKRMEKRDFVQCSAEAERWWDLTCATTLFHRMLKRLHLTVRHFHWNLISWAPSNWNSSKLSQSSDAACHHPTAGAEFLWTATRFCGLGRRSGGDQLTATEYINIRWVVAKSEKPPKVWLKSYE